MSTESIFFSEEIDLEEALTSYFYAEFKYTEILEFLNVYHGHQTTLSTLKRRFKALDLNRRPLIPWRATVKYSMMQEELDASGANLRYRRILDSLKKLKIFVRKEDVRKTILEMNAEGFQQRKRRRLVKRIDGHDKLKPFGFSVHEYIDGFSKKLIWLEVTSSNKVPEIISQY